MIIVGLKHCLRALLYGVKELLCIVETYFFNAMGIIGMCASRTLANRLTKPKPRTTGNQRLINVVQGHIRETKASCLELM